MNEVTRILEGSPRKMAKRLEGSPPKKTKLARRRSAAVMDDGNRHHHRVNSYQALIQQRPSTSLDHNSRSNTRSTRFSIGRSSYETVRPKDRRHSFERRPPPSSLNTNPVVVRGLRGSSDHGGPRLQKSTSGLAFDDTS